MNSTRRLLAPLRFRLGTRSGRQNTRHSGVYTRKEQLLLCGYQIRNTTRQKGGVLPLVHRVLSILFCLSRTLYLLACFEKLLASLSEKETQYLSLFPATSVTFYCVKNFDVFFYLTLLTTTICQISIFLLLHGLKLGCTYTSAVRTCPPFASGQ